MGNQNKNQGRATEIEDLLRDIEAHGVTIIGRKALVGRLLAADDWRQDFVFWSRGGTAIGLTHIYEGPKAERRERERSIQKTMIERGFTPLAADTYTRLLSHPTIMAKAYAEGAVTREQMQTVEEKSLLHKIGAWLDGRRDLLDQNTVRLADARLVRRLIERDANTMAARKAMAEASGRKGTEAASARQDHGTEMAIGVAAAAGVMAMGDDLGISQAHHASDDMDFPSRSAFDDLTDTALNFDVLDEALSANVGGPSSIYAQIYGVDLGDAPQIYEQAFGVDLGSGTSTLSHLDDFGSSSSSFSSDSFDSGFGSGFGSGSGSGFGPDF